MTRRHANGSELFLSMLRDVKDSRHDRIVHGSSPTAGKQLHEARIGSTYELSHPEHNLVDCRPLNFKWAVANVLHFFACTEEAGPLEAINPHAARFLTGDKWIGAYGAIAVPQLHEAVRRLRADVHTRRAVVSFADSVSPQDINRPACISHAHLLYQDDELSLDVYSRSCELVGVMPYDLVLLTNILLFAAGELELIHGSLVWHFGSLHTANPYDIDVAPKQKRLGGIVLPNHVLAEPDRAWDALLHPESYEEYRAWLI